MMTHPLNTPARPRRRSTARTAALLGALALATTGLVAATAPAAYAAGSLDAVSLVVSNNATSSGGVTHTATYTWQFTPSVAPTGAGAGTVTLTVPSGTQLDGSAGVTAYGITGTGCTTIAPTLASGTPATITLDLGSCTVTPGVLVSIAIDGVKNTSTASAVGSPFETAVTLGDLTGTATTGVSFAPNTTEVTVVVPKSLTFTNHNPELKLLAIPGNTAPATGDVKLSIGTNTGYYLSACVPTPITATTAGAGSATIGQLASGGSLDGTVSAFAAKAALTPSGTSAGELTASWGSTFRGYATTCKGAASGSDSLVASNAGPTAGDDITLTNGVSAKADQPAGSYQGTIVYQVAPEY